MVFTVVDDGKMAFKGLPREKDHNVHRSVNEFDLYYSLKLASVQSGRWITRVLLVSTDVA